MINTILEFLSLIGFGGIVWYFLDKALMMVIGVFEGMFPTYYQEAQVIFLKSICRWFLLFLVFGGLYQLWVQSQRKQTPEGYI